MIRTGLCALVVMVAAGCGSPATPPGQESTSTGVAQPYAGQQNRPIRALAPEQVADLLAGRGAGYALAAELNHYPGPTHVLDLAGELRLEPDQKRIVEQVLADMKPRAQELGRELVERETRLDQMFRTGQITPERLEELTQAAAVTEGQLRNTHLAAHLKMKEILTPDQVAGYDELRGYSAVGQSLDKDQHDVGTGHSGH